LQAHSPNRRDFGLAEVDSPQCRHYRQSEKLQMGEGKTPVAKIRTEVHGRVFKDAKEGIQSFVERRAAVFRGR